MIGVSADFGTGVPRAVYDVNAFLAIFSRMHMVTEDEARRAVCSLQAATAGEDTGPIFVFVNGDKNTNPTDNYPIGWSGFSFSH